MTRAWFLGVVLASALGCGSRSTGGDSDKSNQDAANGGTLGDNAPGGGAGGQSKVPAGGSAGGGNPAGAGGMPGGGATVGGTAAGGTAVGGTAAGVTAAGGCPETTVTCTASVTIPIVSLPDGSLTTCIGADCVEQAVADGKIASVAIGMQTGSIVGHVELVDDNLRASWSEAHFGYLFPPSCVAETGNSLSFKSPAGTVVPLFSGQIPLVVSYRACSHEALGSVVLAQQPVDIAALVQALEGGAGGGAGAGNEPGGGAGGAP
jgi:hypothetical protein